MGDRQEVLVEQGRAPEDLALTDHTRWWQFPLQFGLGGNVMLCLANDDGEEQAQRDEDDAEVKRFGPHAVVHSNETSRERAGREREIAGKLIESHREPALLWYGEVDLHDNRR